MIKLNELKENEPREHMFQQFQENAIIRLMEITKIILALNWNSIKVHIETLKKSQTEMNMEL